MPRLTDSMDAMAGRRRSVAIGALALTVVIACAIIGLAAASPMIGVAAGLAGFVIAVPGLVAVKVAFERGQLEGRRDRQLRSLDKGIATLRTGASETEIRLDQTRRRVDELSVQADRMHLELSGHIDRIRVELTDQLDDRIDREASLLDDRLLELVESIDEVKRRASATEDRNAVHTRRLAVLDDKARVTAWHIGVERRVRVARDAERRSTGHFPQRILLQMTLARSGSTRLFDMLRCHPEAFMEPSNLAWKALGLTGRRYPIGLSDLPGATTPVMVLDDVGALVRGMRTDDIGDLDPPTGEVAIEKAHPTFYDFDDVAFAEKLSNVEVEYDTVVDIVYQVRSPLDVMWSMAEYKVREPGWHGSLEIEDIPPLVLRSLRSIESLHLRRRGMVIDYSDVRPGSQILREVAGLIAPGQPREAHAEWLETSFARTSRERLGETTAFVGERSQRTPQGPGGVWRDHRSIIDEANRMYESILTHRTTDVDPSE